MNAKQRVLGRIRGEATDRMPNLCILMFLAAKEIGVTYGEYVRDYRHLVAGNLKAIPKYGIDAVSTISDPMREGSDLGMELEYPPDGVPRPKHGYLVNDAADLAKLQPITSGPRMEDRVRGVAALKAEVGDDYPIIGWVEGAFAQAADIRGINDFLVDTLIEPEFVTDLLEFTLAVEIAFAKAQIEAGADIIGVGDAITSVAGPDAYAQFALPYERKLLRAIKDFGAATKLHICGNTAPFMDQLPVDLVDILDVDWMVPLDQMSARYGEQTVVSGNYDPVQVLLQGSPADVRAAVTACAAQAGPHGASAGGCEVPVDTPEENLLAVTETLAALA
ncbi:MAG: uroporphyrinogen decarboxylase family protein [Propionibacteriaceae bacterium]|jgi:uroporphyrinogen decarboxylase|nr:uroporphyrinogen decarboxylase family protein [Propionibacteriaceae bacterium]